MTDVGSMGPSVRSGRTQRVCALGVRGVEGALHIQGVGCSTEVSEWDKMGGEHNHGTGVTEGWGETEEGEEGHG